MTALADAPETDATLAVPETPDAVSATSPAPAAPAAAGAGVTYTQLRRVDPFQGLMIDAGIWRDAHEYHRDQMRLHHLALHGWGLAHGLEVRLDGDALLVEPGMAVDPAGRFVVVGQAYRHRLQARERGTVYLLLQFAEVPAGPYQAAYPNPVILSRQPSTREAGAQGVSYDPLDPKNPSPPGQSSAGQPANGRPTRVLEAFRIQQREQLPSEPCLELARIDFDPAAGPIVLPPDPAAPGVNQLDTRFRIMVGTAPAMPVRLSTLDSPDDALPDLPAAPPHLPPPPAPAFAVPPPPAAVAPPPPPAAPAAPVPAETPAEAPPAPGPESAAPAAPPPAPAVVAPPLLFAVAAHGGSGWDRHLGGLRFLAREVGAATGRAVRVLDSVPLAGPDLDAVDLLYLAGDARLSLDRAAAEGLERLLDRGGVVLGEGCVAGPHGEAGAREFALSFAELANRLGRQLAQVGRGRPLLVARHVFATPPPGARDTAMVLEAGGVVYCDADYGCAWAGGSFEQPLPRSAIRDALEFGVNLALYRTAEPPAA